MDDASEMLGGRDDHEDVASVGQDSALYQKLSNWRGKGASWWRSEPLRRMIPIRLVATSRRLTLKKLTATSSHAWAGRQEQKLISGGVRDYKVLLRANGYYTSEALILYGRL
eukprot:9487535-Pyramimonas_sp.AAC.1